LRFRGFFLCGIFLVGALPVLRSAATKLLRPPQVSGVKLMSFGFVAKGASTGTAGAALVRGPVASSTIQQLASGTDWGELDYLVIDLPPGTGDIMLTVCQSVGLTSALVVSTPGRLAATDALKGLDMLRQMRVPVLAIVENLAHFTDPANVRHRLFGRSFLPQLLARARTDEAEAAVLAAGAPEAAAGLDAGEGVTVGAAEAVEAALEAEGGFELPIEPQLADTLETGLPLVLAYPNSASAAVFLRLALQVSARAAALRHASENSPEVRYRASDRSVVLRFLSGRMEGREYAISAHELRAHSRDAKSVSQTRSAVGAGVADDDKNVGLRPDEISAVGNYGVSIRWSDGHRSAIYSYEQIAELATRTSDPGNK
ncbi:ParA/MinD ATPase like-domain-containing protein, partial [Pavlovales sp. CCMP2436]